MKMRYLWLFSAILLLLIDQEAFGQEPVAIAVEQPNAPLKITSYSAAYQKGSRYATEGIRHEAEYQNVTDREIVACQIGLVAFSIFNEFLDRTGGIDMDDIAPNKSKKGAWVARAYSDFSFHTGVAYVSKVRFADGEIWEADLDEVTSALREIESDFDVTRLSKEGDDPEN